MTTYMVHLNLVNQVYEKVDVVGSVVHVQEICEPSVYEVAFDKIDVDKYFSNKSKFTLLDDIYL